MFNGHVVMVTKSIKNILYLSKIFTHFCKLGSFKFTGAFLRLGRLEVLSLLLSEFCVVSCIVVLKEFPS